MLRHDLTRATKPLAVEDNPQTFGARGAPMLMATDPRTAARLELYKSLRGMAVQK